MQTELFVCNIPKLPEKNEHLVREQLVS